MSRTRTTRDLCQICWQDANPGEYCPDLNRFGPCAECGDDTLVTRSWIATEAPPAPAALPDDATDPLIIRVDGAQRIIPARKR